MAGILGSAAVATARPGATLLLAEPLGHVKTVDFGAELEAARRAGFAIVDRPAIARSQTAPMKKPLGS